MPVDFKKDIQVSEYDPSRVMTGRSCPACGEFVPLTSSKIFCNKCIEAIRYARKLIEEADKANN